MNPPTSHFQLPISNFQTERLLRDEIVRVGQLLYNCILSIAEGRNLIVATDGNISARLDARRVLCTPSGLCKGLMTVDQLIVVDLDGNRVGLPTAANRLLTPTSEMQMHLEAYRRRPDVLGIVHAHPPSVIAASIAGLNLAQCLIPEVIVTLGVMPTTQYATPSSAENVHAIRELIAGHDAIILQRHGTLVVGPSPTAAYLKTETVDQMARVTLMLAVLGQGRALPADQVSKLIEQRQALGLARAADAADFCAHCGVCPKPDQPCSQLAEDQRAASAARVTRELSR